MDYAHSSFWRRPARPRPAACGWTYRLSALEHSVEPLPQQAHHRRQQHTRDEARERERPTEQWSFVGQHTDRTHERLRGQQRDERGRRGAPTEQVRRDWKEDVGATRNQQSGYPPDQDALTQILAPEPTGQHRP